MSRQLTRRARDAPSSLRRLEAVFNSRRPVIHIDFDFTAKIQIDASLRWDDGDKGASGSGRTGKDNGRTF